MTPSGTASRLRIPATDGIADASETAQIATERMSRARMQVLLDHPYLASAVLQIPMKGSSDAALSASIATDGTRVVYRFSDVAAMPTPMVAKLLLHVYLHVVLLHPSRGAGRNWLVWEQACDLAVNAILVRAGIALPQGWAYDQRVSSWSAERIYEMLVVGATASPSQASSGDAMFPPPEAGGPGASGPCGMFRRVADALGLAGPEPLRLESLARGWRRTLSEFLASHAGQQRGEEVEEIDAAAESRVNWRQLLARFMCRGHDRTYSTLRPNLKHLWRGLRLPGLEWRGSGRIVVAIDTSGSMAGDDLAAMLAEVDALRRSGADELVVVQFDAEIQAVAEFTPWQQVDEKIGSTASMRMMGRGGTDLRLPFGWVEAEAERGRPPTMLIVCTDGFGPLPKGRPDGLEVLFVLTPGHAIVAPELGMQIVMPRGASRAR